MERREMATLPTGGNLRLPKGVCVRERICLPIIPCLKGEQWRPLVVLIKSSKHFGVRRRIVNPFLDAFRIAMFRWSKCQDKREFHPGSLKTKVAIHGFRSKTSRQRDRVPVVASRLVRAPWRCQIHEFAPSRKSERNIVKNVRSRPGRGMAGWCLMWRGAERHGAAWDEHKERTRRRKWDGLGRRVVKRTCNHLHKHRVEGSHHVGIPQAVHVPCRSRHSAVPPQDMLFTSVSRAATLRGTLLLARMASTMAVWPPQAAHPVLMRMATPTFSLRARTSNRFTEQRQVKTATPYW